MSALKFTAENDPLSSVRERAVTAIADVLNNIVFIFHGDHQIDSTTKDKEIQNNNGLSQSKEIQKEKITNDVLNFMGQSDLTTVFFGAAERKERSWYVKKSLLIISSHTSLFIRANALRGIGMITILTPLMITPLHLKKVYIFLSILIYALIYNKIFDRYYRFY
jgi:hypothetical protein